MSRRRVPVVVSLAALVAAMVVVPLAGVAAAGGGCHRGYDQGQTEGTGVTVEMAGNCFGPTVLRVAPGTEVTFVNRDQVVHQLDGVGWTADKLLMSGDRVSRRFDAAGTYPFSYHLHPGMSGAVVVGDGLGAGRVVEITPVTALVSSPSAAPTPVDEDEGVPVALAVWVGAIVSGAAFLAGRRARRPRTAV